MQVRDLYQQQYFYAFQDTVDVRKDYKYKATPWDAGITKEMYGITTSAWFLGFTPEDYGVIVYQIQNLVDTFENIT